MLGTLRGSASTANYQVLQGLPYVILIVVAGASVVSGALLGGLLFQSFPFLVEKFGDVEVRATMGMAALQLFAFFKHGFPFPKVLQFAAHL